MQERPRPEPSLVSDSNPLGPMVMGLYLEEILNLPFRRETIENKPTRPANTSQAIEVLGAVPSALHGSLFDWCDFADVHESSRSRLLDRKF